MIVEGGPKAETILQGLDGDDVQRTARAISHGVQGGTHSSRNYLKYIKAVAGCLPHTNDAAGKASLSMDAMVHTFGLANVFLTATVDDDNHWLIQAYSGVHIDSDVDVRSLSDDDLREKAEKRTELRLRFPGIAADVFEDVIEIILRNVVGWDSKSNSPTEKAGLFGSCFAAAYSVEEQGRKTLHIHILAWIRELMKETETLRWCKVFQSRETAAKLLAKSYAEVSTTELFGSFTGNKQRQLLRTAFDHDCSGRRKNKRKLPEVVDDQQLRNLRHKHGHVSKDGLFLFCPECTSGCRLTNEQAIETLL